MFRQSPIARRY